LLHPGRQKEPPRQALDAPPIDQVGPKPDLIEQSVDERRLRPIAERQIDDRLGELPALCPRPVRCQRFFLDWCAIRTPTPARQVCASGVWTSWRRNPPTWNTG